MLIILFQITPSHEILTSWCVLPVLFVFIETFSTALFRSECIWRKIRDSSKFYICQNTKERRVWVAQTKFYHLTFTAEKSLSSKVIPVQGMLSNPVKSSSICRCFHPPWLSPAALPWKIQIKIRKILHLLLICLRPLFSSYFLIEIERRWWTGWTQRCLRQFDNFYFVLQGSF